MSPSKWTTATVRGSTAYQPKEATEAEVAEYLAGQGSPGTEIRLPAPDSPSGGWVVCNNKETGRVLFSGEGCLTEKNGWQEMFRGSYTECLEFTRTLKNT